MGRPTQAICVLTQNQFGFDGADDIYLNQQILLFYDYSPAFLHLL